MFKSLDHFEIDEIEVFVDITPSTFNIANVVAHAKWHRPSCHSQEQRQLLSDLRAAF